MNAPAVRFEAVHKRYGSQTALAGLSFQLPKGSICALIGPNGAGKSTTMGMLGGLIHHDSGQVDLLGRGPFDANVHAGRVGLMPQDSVPSSHLTLREILRFYATLQGLVGRANHDEVDRRLAEVALQDRASSKYGQLSHGMRRRFSIAQALLGSPELILLDEPTSGIDPEVVVLIRELLRQQGGRSTLLVSSHILAELEALCDYVVFIDGGKCLREGSMQVVTRGDNVVHYLLATAPDVGRLQASLPGHQLTWTAGKLTVHAPREQALADTNRVCLRALLDENVGILEVQAGDSLEQSYLRARHTESNRI